MNTECPEHFGFEQLERCTHCDKQRTDDFSVFYERALELAAERISKGHHPECDVSGCRSKSETCCPCTCLYRTALDLRAMPPPRA